MRLGLLVFVVTTLGLKAAESAENDTSNMQHRHKATTASMSVMLTQHSAVVERSPQTTSPLWSVYNCDCGITTGCRCANPMWDRPCAADLIQEEEEGMDDQGFRQNA